MQKEICWESQSSNDTSNLSSHTTIKMLHWYNFCHLPNHFFFIMNWITVLMQALDHCSCQSNMGSRPILLTRDCQKMTCSWYHSNPKGVIYSSIWYLEHVTTYALVWFHSLLCSLHPTLDWPYANFIPRWRIVAITTLWRHASISCSSINQSYSNIALLSTTNKETIL